MESKSRLKATAGLRTSTPLRANLLQSFQNGSKVLSPVVAVEKKKKLISLIIEAIKTIGVPRKGASYQAIKKFINDLQGAETNHSKKMLKLAIVKGLSTGEIIRSSHSKTAVGVTGSFNIPKKAVNKPMKENKSSPSKTSPPKVKKETQQKKPIAKNAAKAAGKKAPGKKAPVKPLASPSKPDADIDLINSKSGEDGKKISTKKEKQSTKTASKKPNKQVPKKENSSETKKPAKKVAGKEEKAKKEKLAENPKNKIKEVKKTKEKTKSEKQPIRQADQPGQSVGNNKENAKAVARGKKLQAPKMASLPKRKDLSDTEIDVQNHRPIPLKSYSSDTELEISKRQDLKSKKSTKGKERKMPVKN